jgi:hypothetical protein
MAGLAQAEQQAAALAALRRLYEGAPATLPVLAAASGIGAALLRKQAAEEGWKKRAPKAKRRRPAAKGTSVLPQDYAAAEADGAPEERLRRVMDLLLREVEAIGHAARRKGAMPDKARMDAAWSLIRTLEKADEMLRERVGAEQTKRDGEIGDVLRRIDGRIEELARAYAQELGCGEPQRG